MMSSKIQNAQMEGGPIVPYGIILFKPKMFRKVKYYSTHFFILTMMLIEIYIQRQNEGLALTFREDEKRKCKTQRLS